MKRFQEKKQLEVQIRDQVHILSCPKLQWGSDNELGFQKIAIHNYGNTSMNWNTDLYRNQNLRRLPIVRCFH